MLPTTEPSWNGNATNGEAERATLGALLRNNSVIADVRQRLTKEDFHVFANQLVFDAILSLNRQGQPADVVTVAHRLHQMRQTDEVKEWYLGKLFDAAPSSSNALHYADIVKDHAFRRQLGRVGNEIAQLASFPGSRAEIRGELEQKLLSLQEGSREADTLPIVACSALREISDSRPWIWHGVLSPGGVTLFSALWKSGKTTLLAHLLRALGCGGEFCGLAVEPARVLYVTEESEDRWAKRRNELALGDHISFVIRPFLAKPDYRQWLGFISRLKDLQEEHKADVIVFDTLSNLWNVQDENSATQVQAALMPLHQLVDHAALLLVHHLRKGDGAEATGSRGSGALPSFVDAILELRRYDASDRRDRRRVVTGYARWDEVPDEMVVELQPDGSGYSAHGDRANVANKQLRETILGMLPNEAPGWTSDEVRDKWPEAPPPHNQKILGELRRGVDVGDWRREGTGKRGSPYTFWVPLEKW